MCNDFDCQHDQCGICSYTDQDCEYEHCDMWDDCSQCSYGEECFLEKGIELGSEEGIR